MPLPALPLDALLTGCARPFTRPGSRSGIAKSPRDGALRVTPVGLEGDEQGDLRVHGGVEKAIHHYPREHYAAWIAELGEHPLLMQAGAFGENFSTSGWSEADVCPHLSPRFASQARALADWRRQISSSTVWIKVWRQKYVNKLTKKTYPDYGYFPGNAKIAITKPLSTNEPIRREND